MEGNSYKLTPEAGAYVEALKLLDDFQLKLWDAYDKGFGEWDGFNTEEFGQAARRELEQKVVNRLIEPLQEHFKQVLFEEIISAKNSMGVCES